MLRSAQLCDPDYCRHRSQGDSFASSRLSSNLDAFSVWTSENDTHPIGFAGFAGRCFVRLGRDLNASSLEGSHCTFKIIGLQAEMEAIEGRISAAREFEHRIAKA